MRFFLAQFKKKQYLCSQFQPFDPNENSHRTIHTTHHLDAAYRLQPTGGTHGHTFS